MRQTELIYDRGFAGKQFIEYQIRKHELESGTACVFSIFLMEKVIEYAHLHMMHSKGKAAFFISDIVPECTAEEAAAFFEDSFLTDDLLMLKQAFWSECEEVQDANIVRG